MPKVKKLKLLHLLFEYPMTVAVYAIYMDFADMPHCAPLYYCAF